MILAQGSAPVGQNPQYLQPRVIGHRAQPGHPGGRQRDRMRVGRIGLAAQPGSEDPGPGRQRAQGIWSWSAAPRAGELDQPLTHDRAGRVLQR